RRHQARSDRVDSVCPFDIGFSVVYRGVGGSVDHDICLVAIQGAFKTGALRDVEFLMPQRYEVQVGCLLGECLTELAVPTADQNPGHGRRNCSNPGCILSFADRMGFGMGQSMPNRGQSQASPPSSS